MELRQLEAFAAVMSTGSVTAAGRLLGRSQPAISRLLQELEAEIGYALFSRSGPRVTPPSKDSCCTRTWSGRWPACGRSASAPARSRAARPSPS